MPVILKDNNIINISDIATKSNSNDKYSGISVPEIMYKVWFNNT